jgi:hypothetical protein
MAANYNHLWPVWQAGGQARRDRGFNNGFADSWQALFFLPHDNACDLRFQILPTRSGLFIGRPKKSCKNEMGTFFTYLTFARSHEPHAFTARKNWIR